MSDKERIRVSVNFDPWSAPLGVFAVVVLIHSCTDLKERGSLPKTAGVFYEFVASEFKAGQEAARKVEKP